MSSLSGPLGGHLSFYHIQGLVQSESRCKETGLEGVVPGELVLKLTFVGENLGKEKIRKKRKKDGRMSSAYSFKT